MLSESPLLLPLPPEFKDDPTRARYPRQLIMYNSGSTKWYPCTDKEKLILTKYLAVSYRQSDFPDTEWLQNQIQYACHKLGLEAYWLDVACTGATQEEKNRDLYRISDIFRFATKMLIVIKGKNSSPHSEGWLSWGERMWTLPEALCSNPGEIHIMFGGPPIENCSLRMIANCAYKEDDNEEAILIDKYCDGRVPMSKTDHVNLLVKAIWKRASGPGRVTANGSPKIEFGAYRAERVYALMGLLTHRIHPSEDFSEEEAFRRLMDANKIVDYHIPWPTTSSHLELRRTNEPRASRLTAWEFLRPLETRLGLHESYDAALKRSIAGGLPLSETLGWLKRELSNHINTLEDKLRLREVYMSISDELNITLELVALLKARIKLNADVTDISRIIQLSHRLERLEFTTSIKLVDFIHYSNLATTLVDDKDTRKPEFYYQYASSMYETYAESKILGDLDAALESLQKALEIAPDSYPSRPMYCNCLNVWYRSRYHTSKQLGDLYQAINYGNAAILTSDGGENFRISYLEELLVSLEGRFDETNAKDDLDQLIEKLVRIAKVESREYRLKARDLSRLGGYLRLRWKNLQFQYDLEQAINFGEQSVTLLRKDSMDSLKAIITNELSISLMERFLSNHNSEADIEKAIAMSRDIMANVPDNHERKPNYHHNLAELFRARFQVLFRMDDLDEAINHENMALKLAGQYHGDRAEFLHSLENMNLLRQRVNEY